MFYCCICNTLQGLTERILLPTSDCELLQLRSSLGKVFLSGKENVVEPSAVKYLAECYSRAENECKTKVTRRKGKESDGELENNFDEIKIIIARKCQEDIVNRAR